MIKRVSLVRRKPDWTHEAFVAHWMGPHAAIVRQLPVMRGLRFGVVQHSSPNAAAWDGIGELWFDSAEASVRAFATEPYLAQLTADRETFLGEGQWYFVEEHTALKPPV